MLLVPIQNDAKNLRKMTETLSDRYSSESSANDIQSLRPCALDESSLSIGRVKGLDYIYIHKTYL